MNPSKQLERESPPVRLVTCQCRALRAEHALEGGFYWGAGPYDASLPWAGVGLYQSATEGKSFTAAGFSSSAATTGYAIDALPALGGEVRVQLDHGSLEIMGAQRADAGEMLFTIAGEVLSAEHAELIDRDGSVWVLSGLRRGLLGTEDFCGAHPDVGGGEFLLLTGPGVHFCKVPAAFVGRELRYRAVSNYSALQAAPEHRIVVCGRNTVAPSGTLGRLGERVDRIERRIG